MGFENSNEKFKSKTEVRADEAMELLRANRFPSLPACIVQVLRNEHITNPNDVKRIISEVTSFLATKKKRDDWDFLRDSVRELEALNMENARGGDPED